MTENTSEGPWYRQPWLLFLLIFPGAAIIWCTIAITVALNTQNSMVTDDYSKEGRGINMEIARDETAKDLGLIAEMAFRERKINLSVDTSNGRADYPYLILNLFHPTIAERDLTIQFRSIGGGQYVADLNQSIEGRWYFDLRGPDNDWRLKGESSLPSDRPLTLGVGAEDRG
ncbi:FixH family protein [Marinobacter orientalis]|uniref:FixH family protein n=1 Tax=Marinobacter orientalis TaxID=1928859 RepID=A0A7Y0WSJ9_9GAMM|nr:FixH family protein [Marinobacter orientalis]NMT63969.1 FixH family protein [Marinobacter orientalis]TGX50064.1 nitrogen fixation protein FixH [Marinobacter orientalis]